MCASADAKVGRFDLSFLEKKRKKTLQMQMQIKAKNIIFLLFG
jgi:hypothetical protein